MTRDKWIWMPHPGHFICSDKCHFRLSTYVGKYIVSTVGELRYTDDGEIEELGFGRTYETMVFRAKKSPHKCGCKYIQENWEDLDMDGYNDADAAYAGHIKMCSKWSKK